MIEEVKTLWKPDKEVSLTSFYYPSKVMTEGKPKPLTRLLELGEGNFIIEGIVGQGKSILLRNLALQEILSNDARRLPVFIELRTLSSKLSLQQAIFRQLSSYDIDLDDESLSYLLRSGRISYLLDGFDELDEFIVKETLHELEFLTQKYPELQIVVTSRPGNEIQKCPSFNVIKIAQLVPSDYTGFLTKLGLPAIQISLIKEAIRTSPSKVSQLITTPLMLTLVVMVYESEKEIPETLPDFFDRLFRVVFTRHDRLKAAFNRKHHSGLSERRLQALFEAFCFMAMQNGYTRSLSTEQFSKTFDEALDYSENCDCELEKFKLDITQVACLMLEEGIDTTTFLHKSIMEYYAAAFIKNSPDEVASLFYDEVISDSRAWWEVISFLKNIDPYRFSRTFAIPEVKYIREMIFQPLSNRDDSELIKQIEKLHPNVSVDFSGDTESNDLNRLVTRSFGPFQLDKHMALRDSMTVLVQAMQATLPESFTLNSLTDAFGGICAKRDGELEIYEISIPMMVRAFGSKHLWQAIDILSARLDTQETEAAQVIESQERRKLIFTKKKLQAA